MGDRCADIDPIYLTTHISLESRGFSEIYRLWLPPLIFKSRLNPGYLL